MKKDNFYAVYSEASGEVVIFHSLPLEPTVEGKHKVAFVSEGVSSIIIEGELEKFAGKELEYIVKNSKLAKKPVGDVLHIETLMKVQALEDEIKRSISEKVPMDKEMQRTKAYLEWITDGQPKNDPREKGFVEMQNMIEGIKQEHAGSKAELTKALDKLAKVKPK